MGIQEAMDYVDELHQRVLDNFLDGSVLGYRSSNSYDHFRQRRIRRANRHALAFGDGDVRKGMSSCPVHCLNLNVFANDRVKYIPIFGQVARYVTS